LHEEKLRVVFNIGLTLQLLNQHKKYFQVAERYQQG